MKPQIVNHYNASRVPNEFLLAALDMLTEEDYAEMNLCLAANEYYRRETVTNIVFGADLGITGIRWLQKQGAISKRKHKESPSLLMKRGRTYWVYSKNSETQKWIDMYKQFGQFPKSRQLDKAKEIQIRDYAIKSALKALANDDTGKAIEYLKKGCVISMAQSDVTDFFDVSNYKDES